MSEAVEMREVVIFQKREGAEPILGSQVEHVDGQPSVCDSCPTRCGGLEVATTVEIPRSVKAEPGSKERGCKAVDPQVVGAIGHQSVATCFHPTRWRRISQAKRRVSAAGGLVSRAAGIFRPRSSRSA